MRPRLQAPLHPFGAAHVCAQVWGWGSTRVLDWLGRPECVKGGQVSSPPGPPGSGRGGFLQRAADAAAAGTWQGPTQGATNKRPPHGSGIVASWRALRPGCDDAIVCGVPLDSCQQARSRDRYQVQNQITDSKRAHESCRGTLPVEGSAGITLVRVRCCSDPGVCR